MPDMHLDTLCKLADNHPGLTEAVATSFAQAATVLLHRHNHPDPTPLQADCKGAVAGQLAGSHTVGRLPDAERLEAAHADTVRATEWGAYAITFMLLTSTLGIRVEAASRIGTGHDYWLSGFAPASDPDDFLSNSCRLEVSGILRGGQAEIDARLASKLKQTRRGDTYEPMLHLPLIQ